MTTAVTGTPGVGKTTVSKILEKRGFEVLDLNEFIEDKDLLGNKDIERNTFEVDTVKLEKLFESEGLDVNVVEGHLSHYLNVDKTIVLRCAPDELKNRLYQKGWSESKIMENLEAEMLDTILIQAIDINEDVYEIDTTSKAPKKIADEIECILQDKIKDIEKYRPGSIDWTDEFFEMR